MENTIRLVAARLAARQAPDTGQELLELLSNPFKQTVRPCFLPWMPTSVTVTAAPASRARRFKILWLTLS